MTALLEKIFSQVSQLPDAEQEAVAARLLHTLEEFAQEKNKAETKQPPQFGSAKGMFTLAPDFDQPIINTQLPSPQRKAGTATGTFWMSDDFDSPLEDFEECM